MHGVSPFVVCYLMIAALCELGAKVTSLSYPLVQHVLFSCTIGPKDGPIHALAPWAWEFGSQGQETVGD